MIYSQAEESTPEILGYYKDGRPIHPAKPGMIYTQCFMHCAVCGCAIRSNGGPARGAVCVDHKDHLNLSEVEP